MLDQITDYSRYDQPPYLAEQFRESNLATLLGGFSVQLDQLDGEAYNLITQMWIDTAMGAQLDVCGVHVGLERAGRDDESYRTLLKVKAQVNTSSGTPETLITVARTIFEAENVVLTPVYPAKVQLWQDGTIGLFLFFDVVDNTGDMIALDDGTDTLQFATEDTIGEDLLYDVMPVGVGLLLAYSLALDDGSILALDDGAEMIVT